MPVRSRGEPGEHALGRVERGGRLERAGQGPGVRDAVEPEGPVLADPGIREKATGVRATWYTEDFAELGTAQATLAIGSTRTVPLFAPGAARPADNCTVIIEFLVEDVDGVHQNLVGFVEDFVEEPTTMPWGNRSLLFRDPDGKRSSGSHGRRHPCRHPAGRGGRAQLRRPDQGRRAKLTRDACSAAVTM